jgi:hypothetical protein
MNHSLMIKGIRFGRRSSRRPQTKWNIVHLYYVGRHRTICSVYRLTSTFRETTIIDEPLKDFRENEICATCLERHKINLEEALRRNGQYLPETSSS